MCEIDNLTSKINLISISDNKPNVIKQNFKDIRSVRQKENNKIVFKSLINDDLKTLYKNINHEEYKRTLTYLEMTEEEYILKCKKDELFAKQGACHLSKKASRQGTKDEKEQLKICNITSQKCGIKIKNLTPTELRPTKDGFIITHNEMKSKKIKKDCCLKSFDGKISGKMNGFITAKVAYGSGGHQDNVFEEMDTIAEWWKKYKNKEKEILILLIDTDLIEKLNRIKEKYKDTINVMVFNHIEFQEYMIKTYYKDESI